MKIILIRRYAHVRSVWDRPNVLRIWVVVMPKGRTVASAGEDSGIVVLVVANLRQWQRDGRLLPELQDFHFADFDTLTWEMLDQIAPDVILSALMCADFDAVDLARCLAGLGYRGRYRALTTTLPNPEAVRAEVRAVATALDFDLFILDPKRRNGS